MIGRERLFLYYSFSRRKLYIYNAYYYRVAIEKKLIILDGANNVILFD